MASIENNQVSNNNVNEEVELLKGQAMVYNLMFAYAETLALRSAIELHIADIIHSNGHPMSLSQIASKIKSPCFPNVGWLERVMRMLVRKKIFTIECYEKSSSESLYGITMASKWLLHDKKLSLAPLFLYATDPVLVKSGFEIGRSIKDGENPYVKAHGESFWEMASHCDEINRLFNVSMATATKLTIEALIKGYKEGISKLEGVIVDVGGGIGKLVAEIVAAHPRIKGINFDLPHVVANAPEYHGITHIGGDMFQHIPCADNIIIKSILHNWPDDSCLKILRNCQKALSNKKKGRVIIVDTVLDPFGNAVFDDASVAVDLVMMINTSGGKERTKSGWTQLLTEAGFTRINFIPLQTILSYSVLEAFVY